jgi:putative oxidoreductase
MDFLKNLSDPIYALTRIVVGFLFLCHGLQKFHGIATGAETPMPAALLWLAAFMETGGGLLVMIGWFTAIAGMLPLFNKGELAAIYCWVFLMFAAKGPGIWSVDAAQGRS